MSNRVRAAFYRRRAEPPSAHGLRQRLLKAMTSALSPISGPASVVCHSNDFDEIGALEDNAEWKPV
jgi:hypothetical protein